MLSFSVPLLPPSVNNYNHIWSSKGRIRFANTRKTLAFKAAVSETVEALPDRQLFIGDVKVTIEFFFSDRKRRDLDNLAKVSLDSLNKLVLKDDCQITELILKRKLSRGSKKTFFQIEEQNDLVVQEKKG